MFQHRLTDNEKMLQHNKAVMDKYYPNRVRRGPCEGIFPWMPAPPTIPFPQE